VAGKVGPDHKSQAELKRGLIDSIKIKRLESLMWLLVDFIKIKRLESYL
jgi:hypothetical protein